VLGRRKTPRDQATYAVGDRLGILMVACAPIADEVWGTWQDQGLRRASGCCERGGDLRRDDLIARRKD